MSRGTESMLGFMLRVPRGHFSGGLGPFGDTGASGFCQDASWENLTHVLANTAAAETHTHRALSFKHNCLYTYSLG